MTNSLFHYRVKVRVEPWDRPAFDIHIEAVASNDWNALAFAEQRVRRVHPRDNAIGIDSRRIKVKS